MFELNLNPDKYLDYLVELANIAIIASGSVEPIGNNDDEEFHLKRFNRFRRPDLKVEVLK